MILHILRALFVLVMAAVGGFFVRSDPTQSANSAWLRLVIALSIGVLIVCIDILAPRKKLAVSSGSFLGLLVGICIAFALSFVTQLVFDQAVMSADVQISSVQRDTLLRYINMLVGVIVCYLSISFILQ